MTIYKLIIFSLDFIDYLMHIVKLKSARFFAYHGLYPQEAILGNWYEVDLEVMGDYSVASEYDDINHTVNYQALYEITKAQMLHPQKLLETVLNNIYLAIIQKYPFAESVELKLRKLNPPVGGQVAYSEVTLRKNKTDIQA